MIMMAAVLIPILSNKTARFSYPKRVEKNATENKTKNTIDVTLNVLTKGGSFLRTLTEISIQYLNIKTNDTIDSSVIYKWAKFPKYQNTISKRFKM